MDVGLGNASRVAVIGGGITGMSMAAALLFSARCRSRVVDVKVFENPSDSPRFPSPVVLSPECRSRLAALGCRIAPEWRVAELRGMEIVRDGQAELLTLPPGVWVIDDWPHGEAGRELTARALSSVAALHGAHFTTRRVERVERVAPFQQTEKASGLGPLAVRSHGGSVERFHAVVLAAGAGNVMEDSFFPGFRGAPTLPAVEARLRIPFYRTPALPIARLVLWPLPTVEAMYLIPVGSSVHALAWGEHIEPADFCQALMAATRDGLVPEGFEISNLRLTRVPCGVGKRFVAPEQLAVGSAAMGQPFQLGVAQALAACSRASMALVDAARDAQLLGQRYVREGICELVQDVVDGTTARKWLHRSGRRALEVLRGAHLASQVGPLGGGVLGIPGPAPRAVLKRARRAGMAQMFEDAFWPVPARNLPQIETAKNLFYVVDDDADMREAITQLLEQHGAEVVSFGDELALYCAVARRPPTAILLDVVLSWVDGLRLCEGLKQHPLTSATRVFVMSGLDRAHVRRRALKAGAEAFLPKPLDTDKLWEVLSGESTAPAQPARAPVEHHDEHHLAG